MEPSDAERGRDDTSSTPRPTASFGRQEGSVGSGSSVPVVVGRGRRLFPDGTGLTTLQPVETRRFRSGVILLRYRTG